MQDLDSLGMDLRGRLEKALPEPPPMSGEAEALLFSKIAAEARPLGGWEQLKLSVGTKKARSGWLALGLSAALLSLSIWNWPPPRVNTTTELAPNQKLEEGFVVDLWSHIFTEGTDDLNY